MNGGGLTVCMLCALFLMASMPSQRSRYGDNFSGFEERYDLSDATRDETHTCTVRRRSETAEVRLLLDLSAGEVSWKLSGPGGDVAWEGTHGAGDPKIDDVRSLPLTQGEWSLETRFRGATGRAELSCVSR